MSISRHRPGIGKSLTHTQIQHHLKKEIPELELEKNIHTRRADAVWEACKIVFEIQVSSINYEEAVSRCHDYAQWGYQVVWILHEREFNTSKVSPAETFLRTSHPTYFTNGAALYDQAEVIVGRQRRYRGDPLPVQITSPFRPFLKIPERPWPLQFRGDLHTWCETHGIEFLTQLDKTHRPPTGIHFWLHWMGFRILEMASRYPK